jgi:hypothetical protein
VPEHEAPDFEQCAVCGRTALRGERMWDYVTAGGEPRRVCSLCKAQAEGAGWLPLELAATAAEAAPRVSRARALRERLSRVAEQARARPAAEAPADDEGEPTPRRRRLFVERPEPTSSNGGQGPDRVSDPTPARDRRRSVSEARPADPHSLARRAAERFNASDERRTVAGLVRSLGEPHASIEIGEGADDAKVTIAWELSWYQWEIAPGAHGQVRQVRKGDEIEELSEAEREWNARVADDGSLRLTAA